MRSATFETLGRTPTKELISHLEDAVRENSLAKAEAVRLEFGTRPDSATFRQEFAAVFAKVIDPHAKAMETELGQIAGLATFGEVLINEFARGRPNPVERMNAAREAGLVRVAPLVDPGERIAGLRGAAA